MTTQSLYRPILCALFSVLVGGLYAQFNTPRFSYLTASEGLSQNSVNDIYQDEWGYLWFATQDGLNRYDGYEFKVYKPDAENEWSISDNFVTKIIPSDSGNLWILCRYGLNYFERQTGRFYKFYIGSLNKLSQPQDVTYWSDRGLAVFSTEIYELPDKFDAPKTLLQTPIDFGVDSVRFVLGCDDQLLIENNRKVAVFENNVLKQTFKIDQAPSSNQHMKRFGNSVTFGVGAIGYHYDLSSAYFDTLCSGFQLDEIQDILPRNNGEYWVAHIKGISVFKNREEVGFIGHDPDSDGGLSYPLVHSLFEDAQGTVWVGTANGGLNYVSSQADKFKLISTQDGLTDKQVWCVYPLDSNRIWIGTEMGLNFVEEGIVSDKFASLRSQFENYRITAMHVDRNGRFWIGTSRQGIFYTDNLDQKAQKVSLNATNAYEQSISCILEREDGIWIGTLGFLHQLNFDGKVLKSYNEPSKEGEARLAYILSLFSDGDDIYVGAANGLHVISPDLNVSAQYIYQPGKEYRVPNFQFITSIGRLNEKIWISSFGGGLNAFDPETKTFEYFETKSGLSNLVLAGMEIIGDEIWVAHNLGLSSFDPQSERFKNYGVNDGVPFPEFSLGAGASSQGQFYFGGTGGLVHVNPSEFVIDGYYERPIINDFSVNYGNTESLFGDRPELIQEISVLPGHSVISLRFVVPDFLQANRLTYSYKLDGFDSDWVTAPNNERRATYSNLPAGSFTFRVRVANQDGITSPKELSIPVVVIPPLWKRWWFITVVGISLLVVLIVSVRYLSRMRIKRQLRELEMQERVHKERARISMDLHDHVGAQITYLISNLDRLSIQDPSEQHHYNGLGSYAREAMRELRDTVWAIRSDAMQLKDLLQRISQFGYGLFEGTEVKFSLENQTKQVVNLDPAPSLHLMRIIQESIHNVKRHANAKNVRVLARIDQNELLVEVSDDGQGFANQNIDESEHNGLRNMKDRASEVQAMLTIKSIKGSGTTISVRLPIKDRANALFQKQSKSTSLAS